MQEMSWENLSSGNNGDGLDFLKLNPGLTIMRVVSRPIELDIHWENTVDGAKKKIICTGGDCPICKAGHVPTKRFQTLVIDREDQQVKILEGGSSIFGQIKGYALDSDYGDPTKYDIKIKKEGSGRETKYTVVPSPNKTELTIEEREKINNSKTLKDINVLKTKEELLEMGLEVLSGSFGTINSSATTNDAWGQYGTAATNENPIDTASNGNEINSDWNNL